MARKPGFTFYPGDYLRDTQNLSPEAQTAYDRIMCEHMRNMCITPAQLKFFIKRLNPDQVEELMMVLKEVEGGFQIEWVADSILKYMNFCDSRKKNRTGKKKKQVNNTSSTLEKHLEDEIDNEDESIIQDRGVGKGGPPTVAKIPIAPQMSQIYQEHIPDYPADQREDFPACMLIAEKIAKTKGWPKESITNGKQDAVVGEWKTLVVFAAGDKWYKSKSIAHIANNFQDFILASKKTNDGKKFNGTVGALSPNGADPTRITTEGFGEL